MGRIRRVVSFLYLFTDLFLAGQHFLLCEAVVSLLEVSKQTLISLASFLLFVCLEDELSMETAQRTNWLKLKATFLETECP